MNAENPTLLYLLGTLIVYLCGAIIATIAAGFTFDWIRSVIRDWKAYRKALKE